MLIKRVTTIPNTFSREARNFCFFDYFALKIAPPPTDEARGGTKTPKRLTPQKALQKVESAKNETAKKWNLQKVKQVESAKDETAKGGGGSQNCWHRLINFIKDRTHTIQICR
jgi:hypothetical protein